MHTSQNRKRKPIWAKIPDDLRVHIPEVNWGLHVLVSCPSWPDLAAVTKAPAKATRVPLDEYGQECFAILTAKGRDNRAVILAALMIVADRIKAPAAPVPIEEPGAALREAS